MSGNDYLKFLIEELTTYMNQPTKNKKSLKKKSSLSMDQLFGMIPFALKTYFTKNSR
ncbi:MAG TPA: YqzE family protein [Candidatus Dormibacteraeota bacterium]|nr:YqzE family protein [Candidatus Dormibacteraeota bacterium]